MHYNVSHDRGRKSPQYVAGKGHPHTCKEKNTTIKNINTKQLNSLKMHSFITLTWVMTVDEKDLSLLREKGHHTPAKIKIQQLKNKQRIIKFTQNALFFTLTHYNVSHDCGRKRPQSVARKGLPHTCKEKNTTINNTNTEQLNSLKMHSFSLLHTITLVDRKSVV